jgi:choline dehydrogenase-like flavoprotein
MHIDARHLENDTLIEGDLCIIGAGAAGISLALDWANSGRKVILLEGGGFSYEPQMQDLYRGKTRGQPYFTLESSRLHFFGGSTGHWAGYCSIFDEIDFQKRDWVPHSGWPIDISHLNDYYPAAHRLLELDAYSYDAAYWMKKDPSLQSLSLPGGIVWDKVWQFSTPTRFGKKYKDAIVNAPGIHLYTYANAVELQANEQATAITQVIIKNHAGRRHRVRAKKFVLACCAIQNARLLLASNKQMPQGLGNAHDQVGRYFMEHLEVPAAELHMPKARVLKLYELHFFHTRMRAELALSAQTQEQWQILNGTAALSPRAGDEAAVTDTATVQPDASMKGWEQSEQYYREGKVPPPAFGAHKVFDLYTRMEQSPNPASRIMLDTEQDALGVPRAILDWQLTPLEKKSIRKFYEVLGIQLGRAMAGRIHMLEWLHDERDSGWPSSLSGGWHHMGTTRMHDDPRQGVVDRNCQVHGIGNLFVAGSSCFTTGGSANPTLTLVALTLRLSDFLKSLSK